MKNLMLIRTLLDAQKEIFKQELKEKPKLKNYLLQPQSTLERFEGELDVLENIYKENNAKNTEKYPQTINYTGERLELIQPTEGGEYILTSKELPKKTQNTGKHTVQTSVDFKVKTSQKLSDQVNLRRKLFVAENSNQKYGKSCVPRSDEIRIRLYKDEYKPDDFDEYAMGCKDIKTGLGITDEVKVEFTHAGVKKIENFIEQVEKLRNLILSEKQDTISFQPDTLESMTREIGENIKENAEVYKNPKYNDDSTYYNEYWAVTDNIPSDVPLVLYYGVHYNIN